MNKIRKYSDLKTESTSMSVEKESWVATGSENHMKITATVRKTKGFGFYNINDEREEQRKILEPTMLLLTMKRKLIKSIKKFPKYH